MLMGCSPPCFSPRGILGNDVIYIYDLVYDSIDNATRNILQSLFEVKNNFKVTMALCQKQERGSNNCGLFAVATTTAMAQKFTTLYVLSVEKMT